MRLTIKSTLKIAAEAVNLGSRPEAFHKLSLAEFILHLFLSTLDVSDGNYQFLSTRNIGVTREGVCAVRLLHASGSDFKIYKDS